MRALGLMLLLVSPTLTRAADPIKQPQTNAYVQPLIDGGWTTAIVAGVVTEAGRQTIGYGQISPQNAHAPDGKTVFELGSVTKTFTGLLLQQMVDGGAVSLNDPVQSLFPKDTKIPSRNGKQITLLDLATHRSGLPRMPGNFFPGDPHDPYADYTLEDMLASLSGYQLLRDIGQTPEYSNLGVALLGQALTHKAGAKSYEQLLTDKILTPLNMSDSRITLTDSMRSRLAPGHDADGNPAANWDLNAFAPAGGLRVTADDMLSYLAANAAITPSPLYPAMHAAHQPRADASEDGGAIGLCWQIRKLDGAVWHNGQTGGYHTFAGFLPDKKVAVVLLSSTSNGRYLDAIGFRLLHVHAGDPTPPLRVPTLARVEGKILDAYAGDYAFSLLFKGAVKRASDHLTLQLSGQGAVPFYPESDRRFYARAVDAAITFEKSDDGSVKQFTLHQNGTDQIAARK